MEGIITSGEVNPHRTCCEEGECYVCQERTSTRFHQTFEFPEIIDPNTVETTLADGVLSVTLPKKETEPRVSVKKVKIT